MAEWPKVIERFEDAEGPAVRYEVIPADLGRELYEEARGQWEANHDECCDNMAVPPETCKNCIRPKPAALARYEREVGK